MNTEGADRLNNHDNCMVSITVTGVQSMRRVGIFTLRVMYSNLSQTIQRLQRQGAKIINVSLIPPVASKPTEIITPPITKQTEKKLEELIPLRKITRKLLIRRRQKLKFRGKSKRLSRKFLGKKRFLLKRYKNILAGKMPAPQANFN
jgi:hypothetical protein